MRVDYHKPTHICDFFVGVSVSGNIMVKRYTWLGDWYSDYPLYEFPIETLGM